MLLKLYIGMLLKLYIGVLLIYVGVLLIYIGVPFLPSSSYTKNNRQRCYH